VITAFERELINISRVQGVKLNEFLQRTSLSNENSEKMMEMNANDSSSLSDNNNIDTDASPGMNDTMKTMNFVNEWLTVITDSVVALYLSNILTVKKISNLGCLQILIDIDYLR
jgi:hypothetical protein